MLKFSPANAKTEELGKVVDLKPYLTNNRKIYSLDQLAGWSCPFAKDCLAKVHIIDGKRKLVDGPDTKFRCFSASQEVVYTGVYNLRKHNFDIISKISSDSEMIKLLQASMPNNLGILRFHVDGDFLNPKYFYAAINWASLHPDKLFYAYTKSLPYWVKYRKLVDKIPNFVLTASYGGRCDDMIKSEGLRSARVILSESEAGKLPIDHTDEWAANPKNRTQDFCLLIHGVQPAGSQASEALQVLKKQNIKHTYNRKQKIGA